MKSKLFSLIVSVLAAMCLWVYVMTVVNPDVDLVIGNIPVSYTHLDVYKRQSLLSVLSYSSIHGVCESATYPISSTVFMTGNAESTSCLLYTSKRKPAEILRFSLVSGASGRT